MSNDYVLLWLEGPLQAWGFDSRFSRRDTLLFPTKSAVYGLLLAALGATGPQRELLRELSAMTQAVISYRRRDRQSVAPLLEDFHVVGNGYDREDAWEKLMIPKTVHGKSPVGGGSKLTYRYYLQDACFAVIQELPAARRDELVAGLQNPAFALYLGRKSCVPTEFVFQGVFSDSAAADQAAQTLSAAKDRVPLLRVQEGEHPGDTMVLNDVPISFGSRKAYRDRIVTVLPA